MKNSFLLLLLFALFTFTNFTCKKVVTANGCYKGRLEVKGICMNYTIKVLKGDIDPQLIEADWKDENTGKEHQNVFALGSACTFPESIKEGDEFYFTIDNALQDCAVCKAYYPTPQKKLSISIKAGPCN